MKRIISIIIIIAIFIGAGFLLKKNHDTINKQKLSSDISSAVSVDVTEVKEMTSTHVLHLTGVLNPITELNISAQAQGQITSLKAVCWQPLITG